MRISDWSSDVCSSDLVGGLDPPSGLAGSIQRMPRPRQPFDLVGRMADVDDRQRGFIAHALEVGDQFVAARLVEVRQRLLEQQDARLRQQRSAEHTSELQSLMRISYAVFCLKTKKPHVTRKIYH